MWINDLNHWRISHYKNGSYKIVKNHWELESFLVNLIQWAIQLMKLFLKSCEKMSNYDLWKVLKECL